MNSVHFKTFTDLALSFHAFWLNKKSKGESINLVTLSFSFIFTSTSIFSLSLSLTHSLSNHSFSFLVLYASFLVSLMLTKNVFLYLQLPQLALVATLLLTHALTLALPYSYLSKHAFISFQTSLLCNLLLIVYSISSFWVSTWAM